MLLLFVYVAGCLVVVVVDVGVVGSADVGVARGVGGMVVGGGVAVGGVWSWF